MAGDTKVRRIHAQSMCTHPDLVETVGVHSGVAKSAASALQHAAQPSRRLRLVPRVVQRRARFHLPQMSNALCGKGDRQGVASSSVMPPAARPCPAPSAITCQRCQHGLPIGFDDLVMSTDHPRSWVWTYTSLSEQGPHQTQCRMFLQALQSQGAPLMPTNSSRA